MRVNSLTLAAKEIAKYKKSGKTVGLLTGNFDVLHIGHTRLFKFAKSNVDILAVGVDSEEISHFYRNRIDWPFNPLSNRLEVLESIKDIDLLFPIDYKGSFGSDFELEEFQTRALMKLKPTHIITNPIADLFYIQRKRRCEDLKIKLLEFWNTNILEQAVPTLV